MSARVGVLVMAYGSPGSPDEIEPYYTHIRRGRPPTVEQLADLTRRYEAIGGVSPLRARTEAQAAAINAALDQLEPGRFLTGLGLKHSAPFIEDGLEQLAGGGCRTVVGLALAPHFSRGSVGQYHERAGATARDLGVAYLPIDSWHLEPAYLDFLADAVSTARRPLPPGSTVLFTAHSLPTRVLDGDPYPAQLAATAAAVAHRLGLDDEHDWAVCYQSAGRTPDPWVGPDILETIAVLAGEGRPGVLACPVGFVADHLEVRYDLDIEARGAAEQAGLVFARTETVNDDPVVMGALAARVRDRLEEP